MGLRGGGGAARRSAKGDRTEAGGKSVAISLCHMKLMLVFAFQRSERLAHGLHSSKMLYSVLADGSAYEAAAVVCM